MPPLTPRELRAATLLAHCHEQIDRLSREARDAIGAGDDLMAGRLATRAAFEAGYAGWIAAKVTPGMRSFCAAMSVRRPAGWFDTCRTTRRTELSEL